MKHIKKFESSFSLSSFLEDMLADFVDMFDADIRFLGSESVHQRQNTSRVIILELPDSKKWSFIQTLNGEDYNDVLSVKMDDYINILQYKINVVKALKRIMQKLEVEGYKSSLHEESSFKFKLTVRNNKS